MELPASDRSLYRRYESIEYILIYYEKIVALYACGRAGVRAGGVNDLALQAGDLCVAWCALWKLAWLQIRCC